MAGKRTKVLYYLIALNLFLLCCGIAAALYVAHLRSQVDEIVQRNYESCVYGNKILEAGRLLLLSPRIVTPETMGLAAGLADQPCEDLYNKKADETWKGG